eukprot:gnl/Spiro4/13269_TR7046_c0_g1_i1.p1 gnl/Spiro4/13269_TR7046_c0_g1~~gnl/Spiro4/13269_TR7046_c0_g1_i1.p1  ORF type:complete len:238 (+),score=54.94 gnl/Spiro4/13269_TR7046_c0_g1_i1:23-715(+)
MAGTLGSRASVHYLQEYVERAKRPGVTGGTTLAKFLCLSDVLTLSASELAGRTYQTKVEPGMTLSPTGAVVLHPEFSLAKTPSTSAAQLRSRTLCMFKKCLTAVPHVLRSFDVNITKQQAFKAIHAQFRAKKNVSIQTADMMLWETEQDLMSCVLLYKTAVQVYAHLTMPDDPYTFITEQSMAKPPPPTFEQKSMQDTLANLAHESALQPRDPYAPEVIEPHPEYSRVLS